MRRKYILLALLALGLVGASFYFYRGGRVPSGQPPLESLTPLNVADLENTFNAAQDDIRVLLLLSPT